MLQYTDSPTMRTRTEYRLKAEMSSYETELSQYEQAKQEAIEGENAITDDYYRIPAIMQDCKTAYNLSWNGSGAWKAIHSFVLPPCPTSTVP